MKIKNLESAKKSSDQLSESDFPSGIINSDMLNIPIVPNMVSTSINPNMYMVNIPNLVNLSSDDRLQENKEEKNFPNKR